ncbi:MAG: hypothetical protein EBX41_03685 [Chitinophagia bacterium]|nr:hypothetical protein [Chitinophagia bacterium]
MNTFSLQNKNIIPTPKPISLSMRSYLNTAALLIAAGITLFLGSCSKPYNSVNNGQIIATPYSLYFVDTNGSLYRSNDGKAYKVMFPPDGKPARALCVAQDYLIWMKPTLSVSYNNGTNFNTAFDYPIVLHKADVNGNFFDYNQSMILGVAAWNVVYVCSSNPSPYNYLGLERSDNRGIKNSWYSASYDTITFPNPSGTGITSLTQLQNGTVVGYDANHIKVLYTPAADVLWKPTTITTTLPNDTAQAYFSIGHIRNRILAIDNIGNKGVWYSDDLGATWTQYAGIPTGLPLMCVASPFEQTCLVGSSGKGVFILNQNTGMFQPSNSGLPANAIVRNIAFKENIYKNDTHKQYIYLATNTGIYCSTDNGLSWTLTVY